MRTKRLVALVSGGLLTAAVMTGCGEASDDGGDGGGGSSADGGDYCSLIEDVRGEFGSIEGDDATLDDMSTMSDRMGEIADAAPSEVTKEWESMHSAIDDLVTALEDAGVEADVPLEEAVTKVVEEDKSKAQDLMGSMQGLSDVQADVETVQKNVKDECGIDLGSDDEEGSK